MDYNQIALCHFCEHHGPNVVFYSRIVESQEKSSNVRALQDNINASYKPWTCIACRPLETGNPGFISHVNGNRTAIISSDKPNSSFYRVVHQACFQSLSSEVSPIRNSFIHFTDSRNHVSVCSFPFVLKDSLARGFRRLYSVIYLSKNQSRLLQVSPQLEPLIRKLTSGLQEMAAEVYAKDELVCSQKAYRTAVQLSSLGAARSLQDLTQNTNVFIQLHAKFAEILETCKNSTIQVSGTVEEEVLISSNDVPTLRNFLSKIDVSTFRKLVQHLLKGGPAHLRSDDLIGKGKLSVALQMIVPNFECKKSSESVVLKSNGDNLTVHWPNEILYKGSRLVSRLEKIVFMEEVPDNILLQQLHSLHKEIQEAAQTYTKLKSSDPSKLLEFFHVLGYTAEDLVVFDHCSQTDV